MPATPLTKEPRRDGSNEHICHERNACRRRQRRSHDGRKTLHGRVAANVYQNSISLECNRTKCSPLPFSASGETSAPLIGAISTETLCKMVRPYHHRLFLIRNVDEEGNAQDSDKTLSWLITSDARSEMCPDLEFERKMLCSKLRTAKSV